MQDERAKQEAKQDELTFKRIDLSDLTTLAPWFADNPSRLCDFTIGGTFMWRDLFEYEYAVDGKLLFFRMKIFERHRAYSLPLGAAAEQALDRLLEREKDDCFVLALVTAEQLPAVLKRFPNAHVQPERDYFDYLYEAQDLMDLAGRKHRSARNHISKFLRTYGDYAFQRLNADNLPAARAFVRRITADVEELGIPSLVEERDKVFEVLQHLDLYRMLGGLLLVAGEVVGISLGEITGDTLYVHTEKALTEFSGAYPMLMQEFLQEFAADPAIRYVNREDDSGDKGLRRSKMRYAPIRLLEKYTVFTHGLC